MKRNAVIRLIVCLATLFILVGILLTVLKYVKDGFDWGKINIPYVSAYSYSGHNISGYNTGDGKIGIEGIDNIDIDWVSGDVNIVPVEGDEITLSETAVTEITNDNLKMRWALDGSTLRVVFCTPHITIANFGMASKTLTLYVPESCLSSLDTMSADLVSADFKVSKLNCKDIRINSVSGNIKISDSVSKKLNAETVSGGISFDGSTDTADCDTVSGIIMLTLGKCPADTDCQTVSGNIILYLPSDASYTADLDTVSGDFDSEFPTSIKNKKYICGDGSNSMSFETVSGDVSVKLIASK